MANIRLCSDASVDSTPKREHVDVTHPMRPQKQTKRGIRAAGARPPPAAGAVATVSMSRMRFFFFKQLFPELYTRPAGDTRARRRSGTVAYDMWCCEKTITLASSARTATAERNPITGRERCGRSCAAGFQFPDDVSSNTSAGKCSRY
ncbi:hypothetical protein EVAR_66872_1 [Eumeta japonica]|uniref:Uncharacterized protein n=1 Tax=Eumeta variegata TaxID=151549 RepID=A0A4C2A1U9_EUMVA|nr:hypothetical protein EVAR_66872_1 [Eumeta japonica]